MVQCVPEMVESQPPILQSTKVTLKKTRRPKFKVTPTRKEIVRAEKNISKKIKLSKTSRPSEKGSEIKKSKNSKTVKCCVVSFMSLVLWSHWVVWCSVRPGFHWRHKHNDIRKRSRYFTVGESFCIGEAQRVQLTMKCSLRLRISLCLWLCH